MKLQSPLFMSACAGIIVHKTLWYATAPRDHDEALDHDLCFCAAEACFCTGIIAGVLICVWAMPILLILAWEPAADGYDLAPFAGPPAAPADSTSGGRSRILIQQDSSAAAAAAR
eukprot:CAMPEP_0172183504 /NCGR_PEP_ID=MMETSP1050-20130122/19030_1 /TAXON_ID=233186 /ORGANISM="Cryptomonas curvata, Strain CCAP979/52" /LENGTH=114 /DNA_ID=CAMNT_0012857145 /DNA_START=361 /DNA_END=706 /DNA_ORIENTATION=-